mmetsp:Transcript_13364/g.11446  ORF Transcript_13364/g.11446 Transcript_13364/m.11446 type:complete len:166 (-) Transcript_13364:329-826(-)
MDIKGEVFVKNENDIRAGDIITIKVVLTRLNKFSKNKDFTYLKSNRYPFNIKETWYIVVGSEKRNVVFMSETASFGKETFEKEFMIPAPEQGDFELKLFVKPNGYIGLDYEQDLKFKVLPREEGRKYQIHPEDEAIRNEPSLIQQLMSGAKGQDNDSDNELEEEE